MGRMFNDEEEKLFFSEFMSEKINEQLNKFAENHGYDRFLEVTSDVILDAIKLYECDK